MTEPVAPWRILLVAEAPADARQAAAIADAVIAKRLTWVEDGELDPYRTWTGLEPGEGFLDLHQATCRARARRLSSHGHWRGEPPPPEFHQARCVLRLAKATDGVRAVVLVRDTDGDRARRRGWDEAVEAVSWDGVAVGGFPDACMEAWRIALHARRVSPEARRALTQELGIDPVRRCERLSHAEGTPRSAKRVVARLAVPEIEAPVDLDVATGADAPVSLRAFVEALGRLAEAVRAG